MTVFELEIGTHQVKWNLSGYNELNATIDVSSGGTITCVSVETGDCGGSGVPRVSISGNTVTGTLKETGITPPPTNDYNNWLTSKGGTAGLLSNLPALLEMCDAYLGFIQIGFNPTLSNLLTTCDYYLGF
uniref:PEGA domain-containing protein n=1 Tax=viral metagenome TaxID=1070528 RepID=A0A6M3M9H0_9ZZZZ